MFHFEMTVRLRVMPTTFFILQRFYLRVDGVLVRIIDTRIFGEKGVPYLLREWTRREEKIADIPMQVPHFSGNIKPFFIIPTFASFPQSTVGLLCLTQFPLQEHENLLDPNAIWHLLPIVTAHYSKLLFADQALP